MDQTKHTKTKGAATTRRAFLRNIATGAAVAATLPIVGSAEKFLVGKYGAPGEFLSAHGLLFVQTGTHQYALMSPWNDSLYGSVDEAVYVVAKIASESNA